MHHHLSSQVYGRLLMFRHPILERLDPEILPIEKLLIHGRSDIGELRSRTSDMSLLPSNISGRRRTIRCRTTRRCSILQSSPYRVNNNKDAAKLQTDRSVFCIRVSLTTCCQSNPLLYTVIGPARVPSQYLPMPGTSHLGRNS